MISSKMMSVIYQDGILGSRLNMDLSEVKWLHVEPTTRCNAHCPACPRNNNGYGIKDNLVIEDLNLDRLNEVLDQLPNLETVQLNGNLGDCISAKNFHDQLDLLLSKNIKFIQIHTNGSLKTEEWWGALAKKLSVVDHRIYFAIDGLEDTHSYYRQGTDYNKIINNARAFIDNNGKAVWQFILFKHNQHQLSKCFKLSRQLKFKDFKVIKNTRITKARNYKTGEPYELKNYDQSEIFNAYAMDSNEKIVTPESCMHIKSKSLFLSAAGELGICCYLPSVSHTDTSYADLILIGNPKKVCINCCGMKKID
jgi:MoaA/NifB/PqqE/SkfB family radical SAM enzyme